MVNDNRFKINSNLNETRYSLFFSHTPRNLQIPTLRQIHSAIARTLIESRIERIRKELDDHNNNEISEIINKLPKNKNEKKLFTTLTKMNLNPNTEIDKSEKNELLKDTMPLKEQIQYQMALEEDRYQKNIENFIYIKIYMIHSMMKRLLMLKKYTIFIFRLIL
jgi:Mg/Co/Ni transporter MgtE